MKGLAIMLIAAALLAMAVGSAAENAEFSQVTTRVVAALGLGARGVPVEMALGALLGPANQGLAVVAAREAVAKLMKHLRTRKGANDTSLVTVDVPSVIVPLTALSEALTKGWSRFLRSPDDAAARASFVPRADEPLALMDALRAVDVYLKNERKALRAATKAVDDRIALEGKAEIMQDEELLVVDAAGKLEQKTRDKVEEETLSLWESKHSPAHRVNAKDFKRIATAEEKLGETHARTDEFRARYAMYRMHKNARDTLKRASKLILASVSNKLSIEERFLRDITARAHRLLSAGGPIGIEKALDLLKQCTLLLQASTDANEAEASFFSTSEALLGAFLSANAAQARRLMRDEEALRTSADESAKLNSHATSSLVLQPILASRCLAMLQMLYEASTVTRAIGPGALVPDAERHGSKADSRGQVLTIDNFDKTVALDVPALERLAELAMDVSAAAVRAQQTRLADGVSALGGLARTLVQSIKQNKKHTLAQTDREQEELIEATLRRQEAMASAGMKLHPEFGRLLQELRKLAGGLYGGLPSDRRAWSDASPLESEVTELETARAAREEALQAGGAKGKALLKRASMLQLSAAGLTRDALSSGGKHPELADYALGVLFEVRGLWRHDRYRAAARVASAISRLAANTRGVPHRLVAQARLQASRVWAVANSHGKKMKKEKESVAEEEQIGRALGSDALELERDVVRHEMESRGHVSSQEADGVNLMLRGNKLDGVAVLQDETLGALQVREKGVKVLPGLGHRSALDRATRNLKKAKSLNDFDVGALEEAASAIGGRLGARVSREATAWERKHPEGTELAEDRLRATGHISLLHSCLSDPDLERCGKVIPAICATPSLHMDAAKRKLLCGGP